MAKHVSRSTQSAVSPDSSSPHVDAVARLAPAPPVAKKALVQLAATVSAPKLSGTDEAAIRHWVSQTDGSYTVEAAQLAALCAACIGTYMAEGRQKEREDSGEREQIAETCSGVRRERGSEERPWKRG